MPVSPTNLDTNPLLEKPRWDRISEAEARAAFGDDAIDDVLIELGIKGRASADRYRAEGYTIVDRS